LSSTPPGSEAEVGQLIAAYQQYQAQADALVRQVSLTQLTMEGLDRAIRAINALEGAAEGQDMMVPIGSGSFVHAKLAFKENVIINVGAGVSIEKSTADAKQMLVARRAEVAGGAGKLNEVLGKLDQEMSRIQSVLTMYQEQVEAGVSPAAARGTGAGPRPGAGGVGGQQSGSGSIGPGA
jgi:prefoldin alpha subunit